MNHGLDGPRDRGAAGRHERGSAFLIVIFVLVLLAGMGGALLVMSKNELKMSRSSLQATATFYLAEAGLESGRATLADTSGTLSDLLAAAAGSDGVFDFDPGNVKPVYDGTGKVTGFTGYGDDVPLGGPAQLGDGMYIAFLTNDPSEAGSADPRVDGNEQVMVTGIGAGFDGAAEVVQAIVEPDPLLPTIPPCAVMMLGPTPDFYGGNGVCTGEDEIDDEDDDAGPEGWTPRKTFWGTDCAGSGGIAGHYVPAVCAQGCGDYNSSEPGSDDEDEDAEDEIPRESCEDTIIESVVQYSCPNQYLAGPYFGDDAVADVNDPFGEPTIGPGYEIDPGWLSCENLIALAGRTEEMADFACSGSACDLSSSAGWSGGAAPSTSATSILFVDGDLTVPAGYSGSGLLWVTGTVNFHANASWSGPMLVIGEGRFMRTGASGSGVLSGAAVVANVAGADGTYGTADDCEDGFRAAIYHEASLETGDTMYCTDDLDPANPLWTYDVTHFKQN